MILFDRRSKNKKKLLRRLQSLANVETPDGSALSVDTLTDCELFVCFGIKPGAQATLRHFIDRGGSVAIFSSEVDSNLNDFLHHFGVQIEEGVVVRAVYHPPYTYPKHTLVQNGIAIPFDQITHSAEETSTSMAFVYPNGKTLSVETPAIPLLSSGTTSYPVDCPVAAAWEATEGSGRLIVVGSADVFADEWLEREDNSKICDAFLSFLLHRGVDFDPSLGRSDFEPKECVPDIATLSNLIKPCLHDIEPLPQDYTTLLCDDQFGLTMDHIPKVIDLYKALNVPYEPLTLIEPHFNCPHPPLRMATHKPRFPEQPPPELEFFDLDDCFTDVRSRLGTLVDKYDDDSHLAPCIQEAGWILGVDSNCRDGANDEEKAKHVLHTVATAILEAKIHHSQSR